MVLNQNDEFILIHLAKLLEVLFDAFLTHEVETHTVLLHLKRPPCLKALVSDTRCSSPKKLVHRGGGERENVVGLLRRTGRQTPEMPDFVHGRLKHYGPGKVLQIYFQPVQ